MFLRLIALFLVSKSIHAQNDSLMPNMEAHYTYYTYEINNPPGQQYNIGYISLYQSDSMTDTLEVYNTYGSVGYIAYKNNQVYVQLDGLNGELEYDVSQSYYLLYDYDLQIGDTAYQKSGYPPAILEEITTYNLSGHNVPQFHFSNEDTWIKGIGSTLHPFFPIVQEFEISYLYCSAVGYTYGDFPVDYYFFSPNPAHGYCQVNLEELDEITMEITPNPTSDLITFQNLPEEPSYLKIISASGQQVLQKKYKDQVNVRDLPSGVYFVQIQFTHTTTMLKFIKL